MKLINQSVYLYEQEPGWEGMLKAVEIAGKVSHKSEGRITDDSCYKFFDTMMRLQHYACLEFATVYLEMDVLDDYVDVLINNAYTRCNYYHRQAFITTNLRVLIESFGLDVTKELIHKHSTNKAYRHIARKMVRCTTNLQVSHELVRHRHFSFLQESTRYVKYDGDMEFIEPTFLKSRNENLYYSVVDFYGIIESKYKVLRNQYNAVAQEAAQVLCKGQKTDIWMCGFADDWDAFFDLRKFGTTGKPHPQMEELANMIYNKIKRHD